MQSMDQFAAYSFWEQTPLQTPYQPQNSQSHMRPSEAWPQTCSEADDEKADPVQLEQEKLKDENASLRKNANLYDIHMLSEETAKLKLENKVLKVQNDALCGKIIGDNERKHEQEQ